MTLVLLFSEFAKEKDRVESRAGFLLLKEEQKLEKEMNGYMNWICKAGSYFSSLSLSLFANYILYILTHILLFCGLMENKVPYFDLSLSLSRIL